MTSSTIASYFPSRAAVSALIAFCLNINDVADLSKSAPQKRCKPSVVFDDKNLHLSASIRASQRIRPADYRFLSTKRLARHTAGQPCGFLNLTF
ncbi:MAG: hypothetical protein M3007_07315 [Candidatus Eremiobacteraeota bacterium]|nr:hypothetical protein [Candidatus Eremiobacteraeota bacterium]